MVCLVIYLLFTLRIRRGCLLFDNVKTVLYSGFFLIAAVYLSVVLEDVLDSSAESYPTAYLALNAFCILFAITILALEFQIAASRVWNTKMKCWRSCWNVTSSSMSRQKKTWKKSTSATMT